MSEFMDDQLSQIDTQWSMLLKIHGGPPESSLDALEKLLARYQRAVYRYLLVVLKQVDTADELYQEFALRFARGGFKNADPGKGQFRNFLKTALMNLIRDWNRAKSRRREVSDEMLLQEAPSAADPVALEDGFYSSWREELLARSWERLQFEEQQSGQPYFTVLQLRAAEPELTSAAIAQRLAQMREDSPLLTDAAVRKVLQRSRERFAEYLVKELSISIGSNDRTEIEAEAIDLGLLEYCREAIGSR